jgi:hypothetical protein
MSLGAILFAAAPAVTAGPLAVPYHGDWVIEGQRCAPGPTDNNNIRIGARRIQEFEMHMDVSAVTPVRKGEIIAGGRITHGDATYENGMRLGLVDGGKKLAIGEGEDFAIYVRCKR